MVFGAPPVSVSLCGAVDIKLGLLDITNYSVPGLICAILSFINLLQIIVLFRDPIVDHRAVVDVGFAIDTHRPRVWIGAMLWIVIWFACNAVYVNFEV
jgi:hypothetical protein